MVCISRHVLSTSTIPQTCSATLSKLRNARLAACRCSARQSRQQDRRLLPRALRSLPAVAAVCLLWQHAQPPHNSSLTEQHSPQTLCIRLLHTITLACRDSPHGRADFGDQLAGAGARRQVPHPDVARRVACTAGRVQESGFQV